MKHNRIKNLLGAFIDGELKGSAKLEIEEHLKTCSECTKEVEFIKALNSKLKEDKVTLPPDSYWDNFPKKVMRRLGEKQTPGFLTAWVPRLKWELAGGVIVLLLTFVVSKQIIMKRMSKEIEITYLPKVSEKIISGEEGWDERDTAKKEREPIATGKSAIEPAPEKMVGKKGDDLRGDRFAVEEEKAATEHIKPISTVTKTPEVMKKAKDVEDDNTGVESVAGGAREEDIDETSADGYFQNLGQIAADAAKEEGEILSDIQEQEEYVRRAKNRIESLEARRGLIRLLFVEAGRTRKKTDITRAQKEIEIYKDSFPEDFKDTLSFFSDSLETMMEDLEEVERKAAEEETEETKQ